VFLYYGTDDRVLPPPDNAEHIRPLLAGLAGTMAVPGASHWVFLAPCSVELAKEAPAICTDPAGIDRAEVHARINADALAFFRKTLGAPGH
jgi:predicted dienelactone hydrolase